MRRTDGARPKTWRSPDDAKCRNCGRIHTRQACPVQNETCHNNCGKLNHFAAMCRSTVPTQNAAGRQRKRPQRVHAINDADYDTSDQESTIGCLSASVNTVHSGGQPYTTLHVGCDSVPMKFKVDIGAQTNVIPITGFDTLAESRMKQLKPPKYGSRDTVETLYQPLARVGLSANYGINHTPLSSLSLTLTLHQS